MNKKRIIGLILTLGVVVSTFTGCMEANTDQKQAEATESLMNQVNNEVGLPNITNFYEKKTLKNIMEQCDRSDLITYTYTKNEMSGKYVYLGQSMGYGIPYGTEYTNPEYASYQHATLTTLPQADPNGLYKAENVSATWVMLIDPVSKQAKPVYVESEITVSPFKLPKNLLDASTLPGDY